MQVPNHPITVRTLEQGEQISSIAKMKRGGSIIYIYIGLRDEALTSPVCVIVHR